MQQNLSLFQVVYAGYTFYTGVGFMAVVSLKNTSATVGEYCVAAEMQSEIGNV